MSVFDKVLPEPPPTPARQLADQIEPMLKEYTAQQTGDAFGMLMYRLGYKAAMEARIVTIIDKIAGDDEDEEIEIEDLEPAPTKKTRPN